MSTTARVFWFVVCFALVMAFGVLAIMHWSGNKSTSHQTTESVQTEVRTGQVLIDSASYWVEVQETKRPYTKTWTDIVAKMWRLDASNFPIFITATGITVKGDIRWASVSVMDPEGTACGQYTAASVDSPVTACTNTSDDINLFDLSLGTRALVNHFLYQGTYAVMPHINPN